MDCRARGMGLGGSALQLISAPFQVMPSSGTGLASPSISKDTKHVWLQLMRVSQKVSSTGCIIYSFAPWKSHMDQRE